MKVLLRKWAETQFDKGSMPAASTLCKWAETGQIEGAVKMGTRWFVEVDDKAKPSGITRGELDQKIDELTGGDADLKDAVGS